MTVSQLGQAPEDMQRKMCPKHGVAHGVCLDPIRAEIPPDREHPTPCDQLNCSWCAPRGALPGESAKYVHVEDPDYVEPETVTTTASTASCTLCGQPLSKDHVCLIDPSKNLAGEVMGTMEGRASHKELWAVCETHQLDYEPYGRARRESRDCSCGCEFYHILRGKRGADWGVCFNPQSHRSGLLTFEHQGCQDFQ